LADSDLFKVGLLVLDLPSAMRDIGAWLGLEWTPIQESPLELQTTDGRESVSLRYVFSTSGPVYLELIEAHDAGYYAAEQGPHFHHVGRWVDGLAATSAALESDGFAFEAAGVDAEGKTPALFAFHRSEHGLRVELVDRANRAGFEGWLAGGDLDLG
jgi:hypothetical protein